MPKLNALVTGGTRGIGRAVCEKLASDGYNVAFVYKQSSDLADNLCQDLRQKYGVEAKCYMCDLSKQADIESLAQKVFADFETIDVLVNNAGICLDLDFEKRTVSHFEKTFKTNVFGVFALSKIIGTRMVKNKFGKIVNISSDNSLTGFYPTTIDYDASKAALNILTKDLAIEFAPFVNVNAVAPGWVDTDMNKDILTDDIKELEAERILKRRIGKPEDVANLVSFLVSDKAEYINGEIIIIDGGMF